LGLRDFVYRKLFVIKKRENPKKTEEGYYLFFFCCILPDFFVSKEIQEVVAMVYLGRISDI